MTTAVTNFDIHDLARTGTTYGVKKVFLVTPVPAQQEMVRYICEYWQEGCGATANPSRKAALSCVAITSDIAQTCLTISNTEGMLPFLVATTAKKLENSVRYSQIREKGRAARPVLILFGTGYGMTPEIIEQCDAVLDPIDGVGEFNHLPVRAAVAIILDRLLGSRI